MTGRPPRRRGPDPADPRIQRGLRNNLAGQAAEAQVARHYGDRGHALRASRWRGLGGEIDLVLDDGDGVIFVEVKKAASLARAADMVQPRQSARILAAAAEYLGTMAAGQMTPARIDVALVDGDGRIEIIENAIGH